LNYKNVAPRHLVWDALFSAEEHNILGGLGESIARVLALNTSSPQGFVAVQDSFRKRNAGTIN